MTVTPQMMNPDAYGSLGELLWDSLVQFKSETALIEVDRNKETHRLTYLAVKQEVLRADTVKLTPWAQAVLAHDEPASQLAG